MTLKEVKRLGERAAAGDLTPAERADVRAVEQQEAVLDEVDQELYNARSIYGAFNSAHEGCGVLREEFEELWDEVRAKNGARDIAKMRHEAIQTAAMAIRFIIDVCDGGKGQA